MAIRSATAATLFAVVPAMWPGSLKTCPMSVYALCVRNDFFMQHCWTENTYLRDVAIWFLALIASMCMSQHLSLTRRKLVSLWFAWENFSEPGSRCSQRNGDAGSVHEEPCSM